MSSQRSRREFLQTAAMTSLGVMAVETAYAYPKSPNDRIRFACIGVGGKGDSDTAEAAKFGDIVAICDVDERTLGRAGERYPDAKRYTDFRKMFDEMAKDIDAVTVSTPDHNHAVASGLAIGLGKHCFCQKPLTHNLWEARKIGEMARKMKVATQMGNQGTANDGLRRAAMAVKGGLLGTVKELHVWTNRPIWPQGGERPAPATPPSHLHWDTWLGPAPERPYGEGYHTFAWRGWWDFGTGALGDMACHTVNMPFMALDLRYPTSVIAESAPNNKDSYPKWSIIKFEFAATKTRPALTMTWYDGTKLPPLDLFDGTKPSDSGSLIIGDKGKLYTSGDYGENGRLLSGDPLPDVAFEKSPGHFAEFARAIKEGKPAMSNFPDYAVPLTETILLGNLAVWAAGKKIEWNARDLKAKNAPEVASIIKPTYRKGYSLG